MNYCLSIVSLGKLVVLFALSNDFSIFIDDMTIFNLSQCSVAIEEEGSVDIFLRVV
jgi:hypothetical protein